MRKICLFTVNIICCATVILAEQLPYPLQLFYLSPNNVGILPPSQSVLSYIPYGRMKTSSEKQTAGEQEMVEGEASQFHSQDSRGRALFGYTTPDQARIEARSEDGKVRGSYSYLDAWGKAVKVQYWDDGTGFHAAGNNLPGVYSEIPQQVQDTPEVIAAKEQHFKLFQQALAAAVASTDTQGDKIIEKPEEKPQDKPQQTVPEKEHESDQGVVVESDEPGSHPDDDLHELTRYPNLQMFPQTLFDPTHVHDANREAVIVDNPDITSDTYANSLRAAKTLELKSGETVTGKVQPDSVGGFFYSFRYPVPMFVQVRTVVDGKQDEVTKKPSVPGVQGLSVSQKAALFGAIPVAAVHDVQVPPHLRDAIANYQVMPLYVETPGLK